MRASTTAGGGAPRRTVRRVDAGEAWAQPLGDLDLVALEVEGASLRPAFRPTTTSYLAVLTSDAVRSSGYGRDAVVRLRIVATPSRQGAPVVLASATGEIEVDLRDPTGTVWFAGSAGRAHHLTVTVGAAAGPSRTTVISIAAAAAVDT